MQCHGEYLDVKIFKYFRETDTYRNYSLGFGCPNKVRTSRLYLSVKEIPHNLKRGEMV